jgi:hypothetical protein
LLSGAAFQGRVGGSLFFRAETPPISPASQQIAQGLADRGHAHRQKHFTDNTAAVSLASVLDRIERSQRAADMRQYGIAAGRHAKAGSIVRLPDG